MIKIKNSMTTVLFTLILLGCSETSTLNSTDLSEEKPIAENSMEQIDTILGHWTVDSFEAIKELQLEQNIQNTSFFGLTNWSESKGKYLDFEESQLTTNVVMRNGEPGELAYEIKNNVISFLLDNPRTPEEKLIEVFKVEYKFEGNSLVLILDNCFQVRLTK